MSFYPKGFLIAGLIVFTLGAGFFLTEETGHLPPPRTANRVSAAQKEVSNPFPDPEVLSRPWFITVPSAPAAAAPVPQPVKTPDPADKKSVAFLGSYKEQDGSPAYFFKYLPTGIVIILKPGQSSKGWELMDIQDHLFALKGPGGRFEVSY
jgi:hypothetical protein